MTQAIDYEALSDRLHRSLKVAVKLGLEVVPRGGYAMDYSISRLPDHPVGLFGALSIVEGTGARSKLGLTYIQTAALEEGFNSASTREPILSTSKKIRLKKDDTYLKLEAIGKELAHKFVPSRPKLTYSPTKKKKRFSWGGMLEEMPPALVPVAMEDIPEPQQPRTWDAIQDLAAAGIEYAVEHEQPVVMAVQQHEMIAAGRITVPWNEPVEATRINLDSDLLPVYEADDEFDADEDDYD